MRWGESVRWLYFLFGWNYEKTIYHACVMESMGYGRESESLSLKRAIKEERVVFTDYLREVAKDPHRGIDESAFELEFSNFLSGKAHADYQDPIRFFRGTYLTESLKSVLKMVLSRVASSSDESYAMVIDTTFGGGKTHTLIALYHLFENAPSVINHEDIRSILNELGLKSIPKVKVLALDGHNMSGERPLWQHIAKGLGDEKIAKMERVPDLHEISRMIEGVGVPVLLLLDELVVYFSKMGLNSENAVHSKTFLHSLLVALDGSHTSMVVLTIPASEVYRNETELLRDIVSIAERGAKFLTPVSKEDICMVLKRKLVSHVDTSHAYRVADALYERYVSVLEPSEVIDKERLARSYPFHPELVEDIFFGRIGIIEGFQRTRGILKVMSKVVVSILRHVDELPDSSLFISGGEVDLSDDEVRADLTISKVFGEMGKQIVEVDIASSDGSAHAQRADRVPRFGTLTRISTAVYLYSLTEEDSKRGADKRTLFRCLADTELTPDTIEMALKRLYEDVMVHLYRHEAVDKYYFRQEENVRALVRKRAMTVSDEEVHLHIREGILPHMLKSTEDCIVRVFEREITTSNTTFSKLNLFIVDYLPVRGEFERLMATPEYAGREIEAAKVAMSRAVGRVLSITVPNRSAVVLLLPTPQRVRELVRYTKELIACEKLKNDRGLKGARKELKDIEEGLRSKVHNLIVAVYSHAAYYRRNEVEEISILPTDVGSTSSYTEKVIASLKERGKLIESVSTGYIGELLGQSSYIRFKELAERAANAPSVPYITERSLRESIARLVREGEVGVLTTEEFVEPEEINAEVAERTLKSLYIGAELPALRDGHWVIKKELAELIVEKAKNKRAVELIKRFLELLEGERYIRVSTLQTRLPEHSDADIMYALKVGCKSGELTLFDGDIQLAEQIVRDGREPNEHERSMLSLVERTSEVDERMYLLEAVFAERLRELLRTAGIVSPPPPPPPPQEEVPIEELLSNPEGVRIRHLRVEGEDSDLLKEDVNSIEGMLTFLELKGELKIEIRGGLVLSGKLPLERAQEIFSIIKKLAELSEPEGYEFTVEPSAELELNEEVMLTLQGLDAKRTWALIRRE